MFDRSSLQKEKLAETGMIESPHEQHSFYTHSVRYEIMVFTAWGEGI